MGTIPPVSAMLMRRGVVTTFLLLTCLSADLFAVGAKTKPAAVVSAPPTILIFLDVESSGVGVQDHLEKIGSELKQRLVEQGLSTPDVFKVDSPSTRRALAEKSVSESDFRRVSEVGAIVRLCQGMARRLGLVVRVTKVEGTAAELTAINTQCVLVEAIGERDQELNLRVESFELPVDARGRKPTLHALMARRLAAKVAEQVAQWPPVTVETSLRKASERSTRAEQRAATGDFAGAIEEINQAIALAPRESGYYRLAGDYYLAAGDLNFAVVQYRRALMFNANDAESQMRLARALFKQNDLREAARAAQAAIKLGSDTAEARNMIAQVLLARRNAVFGARPEEARQALDDAVKHLRRAVELAPNDWELISRTAGLLADNRQYVEAADLWARVVKAHPTDLALGEQYASALYLAKKYDEALDEYRRVWAPRSKPLRIDAETFRRLGYLVDRKTIQIFNDSKTVLMELEANKLGREQAASRFGKVRREALEIGALLNELIAPTAQAALHAHRKLAYTLFDQAIGEYLSYLDTDEALHRERGMVLQTQAATEYDIARGRAPA